MGKRRGCDGDSFAFAWKQNILMQEWTADLLTTFLHVSREKPRFRVPFSLLSKIKPVDYDEYMEN